MPTKATPEDLFDIGSWITRPRLAKATVRTTKHGPVTFILRAHDIEDWEKAHDESQDTPRSRRQDRHTETLVRVCTVAIVPGTDVDLDAVEVADLELSSEYIRAVRKDIKTQWHDIVDALNAATTTPEPDPS